MWSSKVLAFATPVVASTIITCVLVPAVLPRWSQTVVGWCGLLMLALLLVGWFETMAVRVLCHARSLTAIERQILDPTIAIAGEYDLAADAVLVARRPVVAWAVGVGRRTVVLSPTFLDQVNAQHVSADEAAAIIGRGVGVCRAGLTRNDPALLFWTIPWRLLASFAGGRGLGSVLAFAWAVRPVVGAAAVYVAVTNDPRDYATAGGVIGVLALTYLVPQLARAWDAFVEHRADELLAKAGLGAVLANYLRRTALPSVALTTRLARLDPPEPPRPILRLVS